MVILFSYYIRRIALKNTFFSSKNPRLYHSTHFTTLKELQKIIKKLLYNQSDAPSETDKLFLEQLFDCRFDIQPSVSIFYQKIQWLNALAAQTYLFESHYSISPDLLLGFNSKATLEDLLKEPSLPEELYVLIFKEFSQFLNTENFTTILSHISDEQLKETFLKNPHYLENYLIYADEIPVDIVTFINANNLLNQIDFYRMPLPRLHQLKSFELEESLRMRLEETIENYVYESNQNKILSTQEESEFFQLTPENEFEEFENKKTSTELQDIFEKLNNPIEDSHNFMQLIIQLENFLKEHSTFTTQLLKQSEPLLEDLSPEMREYLGDPSHVELFLLVTTIKQGKGYPLEIVENIIRHTNISTWQSYPVTIREELIALTHTILASEKTPTISLATHSIFSPEEDPLEALIQKLRASLETPGLIK